MAETQSKSATTENTTRRVIGELRRMGIPLDGEGAKALNQYAPGLTQAARGIILTKIGDKPLSNDQIHRLASELKSDFSKEDKGIPLADGRWYFSTEETSYSLRSDLPGRMSAEGFKTQLYKKGSDRPVAKMAVGSTGWVINHGPGDKDFPSFEPKPNDFDKVFGGLVTVVTIVGVILALSGWPHSRSKRPDPPPPTAETRRTESSSTSTTASDSTPKPSVKIVSTAESGTTGARVKGSRALLALSSQDPQHFRILGPDPENARRLARRQQDTVLRTTETGSTESQALLDASTHPVTPAE